MINHKANNRMKEVSDLNMTISMIACISSNAGLGDASGELLFHIKDDLNRFKQLTEGQIVIQGRKTFDSIISLNGKPLPNRTNVVLTRDENYVPEHREQVFNSVDKIINHHKTFGEKDKQVFIIGGEETYRLFLEHVDQIYLTIVNKHVEEATAFYPIQLQDSLNFQLVEESEDFYSEKYDAYYKFTRHIRSKEEEEIDDDSFDKTN